MKKLLVTAFLVSTLMAQGAYAFSVDTSSGVSRDGASNFGDPDDKIPFPHVADDGRMSNQLQSSGGVSVGVTNSNNSGNAFQGAMDRMQQ